MRSVTLLLVALLLSAGCSDYDVFGPGGRDFEGFYDYTGDVDEHFADEVNGEIIVSRQYGDRAEVVIDWTYYESGAPLFRIRTDRAAIADLDRYGNISFDFEGELFLYGRTTWFRLSHDGRLDGRTIYGDWRLRTDLPSTDIGSFSARR
jgi:hypothetical protein